MDSRKLHLEAGEVLRTALELPEGERRSFAESTCRERPEVLAEVLSLLAHDRDDSFLEASRPEAAVLERLAPTRLPERIGPFRIERLLGWGGAGLVYAAVEEPSGRSVALKVLRAELAQPELVRRFRRESEILARLDHPGIARALSAGVAETAAGPQAYLAMELVEGAPLLEHAASLDREGRLRLVIALAEIVDHAHARGIVHRDLKPANILVRDDGAPVVLDFGIARRLQSGDGEDTSWPLHSGETVTGQLLGTLAYMSPEQAGGRPDAIDARSDVYALGVILYEVLTERLPHDTRDKLITEALRMIERGDTTPLSHYGADLAGDLEAIVGKALAPEPRRRYASAGAFAADLWRFVEGERVRARLPGPVYRARRFLARHPRASSVGLGAILVLATGLAASLSNLRVVEAARADLDREHALTLRFSDALLLDRLVEEVDELWPAHPRTGPRFDGWMERADALASNRDRHEARAIGPLAHAFTESERAGFATLTDRIDGFLEEGGPRDEIEGRRAFARELAARTVDAHAEDWAEACAAVADEQLAPHYRGLELSPQVGLVPLGPDPGSGLWEFALYGETGAVPTRDPATGRLRFDTESAVVFVLVPGGTVQFGAQRENPAGMQYDPDVRDHEQPLEAICLEPFFLSKFEWNQAQWRRVNGDNPSYYAEGDRVDEYEFGGLAPVESVSWTVCLQVLERLGLTLPTEAQWEYAARARSRTRFVSGWDAETVLFSANLNDGGDGWRRDGFRVHAPVGSFPPNGFGLHDVTGNVSEWCLDVFKVDCRAWPIQEGTGLRLTPEGNERVRRGGAFTDGLTVARLVRRDDQLHYLGSATIGFRAARRIDP